MKKIYLFLSFLVLSACQPAARQTVYQAPLTEFQLGVDNFLQNHLHLVKNKKVGLLTNPSGVNKDIMATSDLLFAHPDVQLTALFGREHGIRGAIHGGLSISDTVDKKTDLPVYSLYGKRRKPTPDILENVDILIVDIQDIGLRGYTYIYTMAKVMEAAAENDKEVIVFDRPNPIGGLRVEGNLVASGFFSFIGLYPIPYQHGMTIGELARLFNEEYNIGCKLTVVPMLGWKRHMMWDETGLSWVPTSPHVPHWETILYMGATGTLGELRKLSEGVGYTSPFELVGAPWIDGHEFADSLNALKLPGIHFRPLYFRPYYFNYIGEICQGVQLHISDIKAFRPYSTGLYIMQTHIQLYPEHDLFENSKRQNMFNQAMGTDKIKNMLQNNIPVTEIEATWQQELNQFKKIRQKYLIY